MPEVAQFKVWVASTDNTETCEEEGAAEPPMGSDVEELAKFSAHALQCFLARMDLPMESDDLWSLQEVNLIEGHIEAAKSAVTDARHLAPGQCPYMDTLQRRTLQAAN